jgi:hypothetical protein
MFSTVGKQNGDRLLLPLSLRCNLGECEVAMTTKGLGRLKIARSWIARLSNASSRSTYRDGTSVQIAGTSSNAVGLANTRDCDQRVAYDGTAPIGPQESRLRDSGCLSTGQSNKEAQKHLCPIQLQVTAVLGIHQGCNR